MHAATDRLEFAPPPTPGIVRALGLAVLAHAFLLAALTWGVHWKREAMTVTAEAELWSALPQQAAPKPVEVLPEPPEARTPPVPPAPLRPAPPQAQPKLPDVDIAIEREKLRLKKEKEQELQKKQELEKQRLEKLKLEKLKQDKLLLEKKRLQDKRDQDRKAAEDKKKSDQDSKRKDAQQAQQESKKLEVQRQENIKRMTGLAGATGASDSTGTAKQPSGPSAGYAARISARIKANIVFADEIAGNPTAKVEVSTAPDGTMMPPKMLKSSGVKSWDDAVLKAIEKTAVLPRDVDGRVPPILEISFRPKD
jgi:colicin import membrane protein